MKKKNENNLQEEFLLEIKASKISVEVNLVNGLVIKGKLISFDNFSLLLSIKNNDCLFYKHAISYIRYSKKK